MSADANCRSNGNLSGARAGRNHLAVRTATKTDRDLLLRNAELVYRQTSPDGAGTKIPPTPRKPS